MAPKPASRAMQPTAASSSRKSALEQLKTSHLTAITNLENSHATETAKLRAELDKFRSQSSKLDTVEAKIMAVEDALRESKTRATQKEQELHKTIQKKDDDRNQLAQVVEELKEEIDRCQVHLDEDAKKQADEKKALREENKALKKAKVEADKRAEDMATIVAQLQNTIMLQAQELSDSRAHQSDADLRYAKLAEEAASDKEKSEVDFAAVSSDLQSKIMEYQQQLEDSRAHQSEADSRYAKLAEEAAADKERSEADFAAVSADLQTKIMDLQRKFEDACARESETNSRMTRLAEEAAADKERLEVDFAAEVEALRTELEATKAELELQRSKIVSTTEIGQAGEQSDAAAMDDLKHEAADGAQVIGLHGTTSVDQTESVQTGTGRPRRLSDPFLQPAAATTSISTHNAISNGIGEWDGKMTLEGTLESLRIQTEQLMEVHDDILAENQRMAHRINSSRTGSRKQTPSNE